MVFHIFNNWDIPRLMSESSAEDGDTVELFTDGACSGNPGPGGWGAILRWREHERELSGGEPATTNNRMELEAVIQGLRALKKPSRVVIYTDSQYVQRGMTEWLRGWKAKDFKVKGGGYRPNHDQWRELDKLAQLHHIDWRWIRGHSGHVENERADKLAVAAARAIAGR
jgi:ribonuclease HI